MAGSTKKPKKPVERPRRKPTHGHQKVGLFFRGTGDCDEEGVDIWLQSDSCSTDMDVSENRGTPKWMVYNVKPY